MSKRKIILVFLIAVILFAGGFVIFEKFKGTNQIPEQKKSFRIGVLQTATSLEGAYTGFKEKMKELGYEEGINIVYDYVNTNGDITTGRKVAAGFVEQKYDLIYAIGNDPAKASREATQATQIPVVFSVVSDPVGAGLVKSLQASGTNIAGVTPANQEAATKRVELLKQIKPDLNRIVLPYNDSVTLGLENIKKAAQILGVELLAKYVVNTQELDTFLSTFAFKKTDALLRSTDSISAARVSKLIETANKNKIPLAGSNQSDVRNGALISYGANYGLLGQQAAVISDEILRGQVKPADLPVQFPEKFELAVNKDTAKIIGLEFTPEFLSTADLIIGK